MTFVLAWVAFPLVIAALGAGWGVLVEELSGARLPAGALLIPVGLAAAIVVAALMTTNRVTAPLAVPCSALVALIGLVRARSHRSRWSHPAWPLVAALAVLLAYGAPVLATGTASFTGWIKLDDTSTWFAIASHIFSDGRSTAGLPASTYKLVLDTNLVAAAYPIGGFVLLGIGHALVGVDVAWVFQPYLGCAGSALTLCLYALAEPVVPSRRLRALVAFIGAQPALLYGYGLWGGIKEMTAACLIALVVALAAAAIRCRPVGPRGPLPLAVATAALIVTFGPGTAIWVLPALGTVAVVWLVGALRHRVGLRSVAASIGVLAAAGIVLSLPTWILLARSLQADAGFVSGPSSKLREVRLGNLRGPLSPLQLAGIWPVADFRAPLATSLETVVLIGAVIAAGLAGIWASIRARAAGPALYAAVALCGSAVVVAAGGVPWVVGKSLAIASPAILFAGAAGAAMLWSRSRPASAVVLALIAGGVLWSNVLQYRDATIAPVAQLGELAHIDTMLRGVGPTFVNEYEVYADRYFLRDGAPVEPAEFRPTTLPLRIPVLLTKTAAADLDSFGLQTLLPYRSIVTRRSPVESRPSSLYRLRWQGAYYDLWQRAAQPTTHVLAHIPFGDSNQMEYCGNAQNAETLAKLALRPNCSVQPVAPAPCTQVGLIARFAVRNQAELVADERPPSIVEHADQSHFPVTWYINPATRSLAAVKPGSATFTIAVKRAGSYSLYLGGSFGRGFAVSVDRHTAGRVRNQLAQIDEYAPIADLALNAGTHTITLTAPGRGLAPGSGDALLTTLSELVLEPDAGSAGQLVTLSPAQASRVCGRSVDWIEVVKPQTPQPLP